MHLLRHLLTFALVALPTYALHESEVGIVDWHTKLIGVPLYNSHHTAPVFHDDLVVTATSSNVLAALNGTDGSVVWRSIYDAEDPLLGFKIHDTSISSLSGPGGSTLRTYDLSTGHLLLEKRLHNPLDGRLREPQNLGVGLVYVPAENGNTSQEADVQEHHQGALVILTNGDTARRVDVSTGEVLWEWRSPDQGSLITYTHLHPTPSSHTLYLAGLARSQQHNTLHVTTLNMNTGEVIASVNVPANVGAGIGEFMLVGSGPSAPNAKALNADPCLVWLSPSSPTQKTLFSAPLTPSLTGKVLSIPNASYKRILDVGLGEAGMFMAIGESGEGVVLGYGGEGVRGVWSFGGVASSNLNSESHFVGALNENGEPRIARVYWSNAHNQAIHQTFEAHLDEGKGSLSGFAFPFETREHGVVRHVAFAPSPSPNLATNTNTSTPSRLLLTTSTGSLQLWSNSTLLWVREESLAQVQVARFVELPPAREDIMGGIVDGQGRKEEGFWGRVGRQIGDAKNFPQYLLHFITRFATGSYASPTSPLPPSSSSPLSPALHASIPPLSPSHTLTRDQFSFRQLLITATASGKLFALDTSTGAIVWSRVLGLGWAGSGVGGRIVGVRMFGVGEGQEEQGGIVLVAQRNADNGLVDTVVFHFDPLTGDDVKLLPSTAAQTENENEKDANGRWIGPLEGVDVIQGPLVDVFVLPDGKSTIGFLDEFLQVQLYPDTPTTRASLTTLAPSLHLALRAGSQILGHQLGLNEELSLVHVAYPTWGVSFGAGEEVLEVIKPRENDGVVASIGKVRGDRSTLYKYLNRHLSVVVTSSVSPSYPSSPSPPSTSPTTPPTCGLYLLDTVKGTVIYHASLPAAEGKCSEVRAALEENWLVYSYFDDEVGVGEGSKGYRVVSVEIYEGYGADEKIRSSDISSYSNKTTEFSVYEQAFVMPHGITAIAPTTTKFGVSTKDMIVASRKNSIQSIPRRLLNPRRPKRKPTNEEMEEMLVQYDPVLPDDPRLILSHYYEIANVRQILTAPSLLESTSLVLAIGTDLFLTRIATSGTFDVLSENFNKVQLVLTVIGLAIAIFVTKPMVSRKRLRERWYQ
ncbi:hypothetical protein HYDPIDRAFT_112159 [Hydnomerulius pinastri MD-312]|uniref:ER membrane protein complex subunit 1 n=1 Tax=Hydnomerulius pinastri MD-312 TaxID=994086 RepID=A0A0C9WFI4_9AGAM|nr:hypothetical protein HYDPIDRAFT_112159 [Hydnomerulius pinastri MD-312]